MTSLSGSDRNMTTTRQVSYSHRLHEIIAFEQPYTFLYVGKWTAILDKRIVIKDVDSQGKVGIQKDHSDQDGELYVLFQQMDQTAGSTDRTSVQRDRTRMRALSSVHGSGVSQKIASLLFFRYRSSSFLIYSYSRARANRARWILSTPKFTPELGGTIPQSLSSG